MDNKQTTLKHYKEYNQSYLDNYGPIIQSYISKNPNEMLAYMAAKMQLKDGDNVLDAGSGFGGPAYYFSKLFDLNILGINIDLEQVLLSKMFAKKNNISNIKFKLHDFHELYSLSSKSTFNKIYFLESIGHCNDLKTVLKECYKVLSKDGLIFIKTFFERDTLKVEQPNAKKELIDFYGYNTFNYDEFKKIVHESGFYIEEVNEFPKMGLDYDKVVNFEKPIRDNGLLVEGMDHGWKNFSMKYIILKDNILIKYKQVLEKLYKQIGKLLG